jgi:hypothetical protein
VLTGSAGFGSCFGGGVSSFFAGAGAGAGFFASGFCTAFASSFGFAASFDLARLQSSLPVAFGFSSARAAVAAADFAAGCTGLVSGTAAMPKVDVLVLPFGAASTARWRSVR